MIEMQPQTRRVPAWVVVLVLVGCVGGAGWFLWKYMKSGGSQDTEVMVIKRDPKAVATRQPRFGMRNPGAVPPRNTGGNPGRMLFGGDGVFAFNNAWRIRSGQALATMDVSSTPPRFNFTYVWSTFSFPSELVGALEARRSAVYDPAAAARAKVTPEQVEKLRALGEGAMAVTAAEREEFSKLWTQREQAAEAARGAADEALVKKLGELSAAHVEEYKQNFTARAKTTLSILSPEQVQALRSGGTVGAPASGPSTQRSATTQRGFGPFSFGQDGITSRTPGEWRVRSGSAQMRVNLFRALTWPATRFMISPRMCGDDAASRWA